MPLSHLYTFIALLTISILLITSYSFYTNTVRAIPEIKQLKNILDRVAAKGNKLLTLATVANSSAHIFIQLPPTIGYQEYWVRVQNDSSNVWVEGALGLLGEERTKYQVFLPGKASTAGYYVGGHGSAILECYMNGSIPQLNLRHEGG